MKLKVCGMKYPQNINQLIELLPDYIGFIFYPKSKRYMADFTNPEVLKAIPDNIKKVGVFVNESVEGIRTAIEKFCLDVVQLHGNENPESCKKLKEFGFKIIKAFQVHEDFDFAQLDEYKDFCDYFLFDTQTPLYGGSGHKFDWQLLKKNDNEKPFFLSGGIGLEDVESIRNIKNLNIHAIDVNSKFEIEPALKNINQLKEFKTKLFKD